MEISGNRGNVSLEGFHFSTLVLDDPRNLRILTKRYQSQWMNTSFMQLTTVVQAFENAVLCAGDGRGSWDTTDKVFEGG